MSTTTLTLLSLGLELLRGFNFTMGAVFALLLSYFIITTLGNHEKRKKGEEDARSTPPDSSATS